MQELIDFIGYGLCHQLPERTLHAGAWAFPVCARDTGIYLAIVLSICILALLYRRRHDDGLPSRAVIIVLVACIVPLAVDGVTSYAHLRTTTNTIRYVTGILAGGAAGAMLFWALRNTYGPLRARSGFDDTRRFLGDARLTAAWVVLLIVISTVAYLVFPFAAFIGPLLICLCIVATFFVVNMLVVSLTPAGPQRTCRLWPTVVLVPLFTVIEFALLIWAKTL